MSDKIFQIVMALIGLVATLVGVFIAFLAYQVSGNAHIEQRNDNRLDELIAFIAMTDDEKKIYLDNRNND